MSRRIESARFNGFIGDRAPDTGGGMSVWIVGDGDPRRLPPRNEVHNHSPDGFQWGYGGSGPAQLALAICCEVVGVQRAVHVYQNFKSRVVGHLPDTWELARAEVQAIIEDIERERGIRE